MVVKFGVEGEDVNLRLAKSSVAPHPKWKQGRRWRFLARKSKRIGHSSPSEKKKLSMMETTNSSSHHSEDSLKAPQGGTEYPLEKFWRTLGLKGDPFRYCSTEEELTDFIERVETHPSLWHTHLVLSYFYPPYLESLPQPKEDESFSAQQPSEFFNNLLLPAVMSIYGEAGTGKTMIAVAFEAWLRYSPLPYLVSYITLPFAATEDQKHFESKLAQHIILDVLIQWIEKAHILGSRNGGFFNPGEEARLALARGLGQDSRVGRLLERLLEDDYPDNYWQAGLLWSQVGRHIIRPVSLSSSMREILKDVRQHMQFDYQHRVTLEDAMSIMRSWGFHHAFVLADEKPSSYGIRFEDQELDTEEEKVLAQVRLLSEPLPDSSLFHLLLFLSSRFMPVAMQMNVQKGLTFKQYRIKWDWNALKALTDARLRAYGARFDLGGLVEPTKSEDFMSQLRLHVRDNPQELIRLLSRIVQCHVEKYPSELFLREECWQGAQIPRVED